MSCLKVMKWGRVWVLLLVLSRVLKRWWVLMCLIGWWCGWLRLLLVLLNWVSGLKW